MAQQIAVFDPCPVLTVTVEALNPEAPEIHIHAGGQGVWIARMAGRLGAQTRLCTPLGGETGAVIGGLLNREPIGLNAVEVGGTSGAYVHDRRREERVSIAETSAPALGRHELDDLYATFVGEAMRCGTAVLAGQRSPVVPPDTYGRLASDLRSAGVNIVADLSGDALKAVLGTEIALLKLSAREVEEAGLASGESEREIVMSAHRLREQGAEIVLISRGVLPALALIGDRLCEVRTPAFDAPESAGTGDSMTAGAAVGVAAGCSGEVIVRKAAAAGTMNAMRHGLGTGESWIAEELEERVEIREWGPDEGPRRG